MSYSPVVRSSAARGTSVMSPASKVTGSHSRASARSFAVVFVIVVVAAGFLTLRLASLVVMSPTKGATLLQGLRMVSHDPAPRASAAEPTQRRSPRTDAGHVLMEAPSSEPATREERNDLAALWQAVHPPLPARPPEAAPSPPPRARSGKDDARGHEANVKAVPSPKEVGPANSSSDAASLDSADPNVYVPAGLAHRAQHLTRGWRVQGRAGNVAGANTPDDPDVVFLREGETGEEGLQLRRADVAPASTDEDVAALERARRQHELQASVAIVVLSAPRMAGGSDRGKSGRLRNYFRTSGTCGGVPLRRIPIPDGSTADAHLEALAEACDEDARCTGFEAPDALLDRVEIHSCGLTAGSLDASAPATLGVYSKYPVTIAPQPAAALVSGQRVDGWWMLHQADVHQNDLRAVDPTDGRRYLEDDDKLRFLMRTCEAEPECEGFHWPSGWLKKTVDITHVTVGLRPDGRLYSRRPLPPADYLTGTVTSLVREIQGQPGCGSSDRGYIEPGATAVYPSRGNKSTVFEGRAHLYVVDTSPLHMQLQGTEDTRGRGPFDPDYWFASFAYLRRTFAGLACTTFLPAPAYARWSEAQPPPHGRGLPVWHPDNRNRMMVRGQVGQTLDFASAFRHAAGASPTAHLMVWEDDCTACAYTLEYMSDSVEAIKTFDPQWGALKVGNGGSGLLFQADLVGQLVTYLATRRGSENVDVSMWRYLHSGAHSDYLSIRTFSAHRGYQSSFRAGFGPTWGRVACGNDLDFYWGHYGGCDEGRVRAAAADGSPLIGAMKASVCSMWRCSVYSPATLGMMPPR